MKQSSGMIPKTRFTDSSIQANSGQSVIEYILLLGLMVTAWLGIMRVASQLNLQEALLAPLKGDFARVYKYGHPKAKGKEEGTPIHHPRFNDQSGANRLFINPRS